MAQVHAGLAKHKNIYFALEQTAGKGQRGKRWNTGTGENIAMSVVIQPSLVPLTDPFALSMLVALSCSDLLQTTAKLQAAIKWPNDIYLDDRKAGGILIENVFHGTDWLYAVIGIGVNVNQTSFDADLPNPVSVNQVTGKRFDILVLASELATCLNNRLDGYPSLAAGDTLDEYNRRLYKLAQTVTLKRGNISFQARILGVDSQGKLLTRHAIEQEFDWGEVEWKNLPQDPAYKNHS